jgi:hypothetical protein
MRLDNEKPSANIEDRRGRGGGFGFPRGVPGASRINLPMGGRRGGLSLSTVVMLVLAYFALKLFFGVDLLEAIESGAPTTGETRIATPDTTAGDADTEFVSRVLGSTERVWTGIFRDEFGRAYEKPKLVLFSDYVQSACGAAQAAMGPFYCPGDRQVYIDLGFYRELKDKLGAPGDSAQAYVIAHEVGHHVQTLLGISAEVNARRARVSEVEGNALSVRLELQADCLAGLWTGKADATAHILEEGDIEEALNAAAQIGDDRLQKRSQGYVVEESFTHGSSAQRERWFRKGFGAAGVKACDTFGNAPL